MIKIRPIARGDFERFYGHPPPFAVRGLVALEGNNLVGIAGVLHTDPLQAFSSIQQPLRESPRLIVQALRLWREMLQKYTVPVYAMAHPEEPTAPGFLRHVGFQPLTDEVFVWQTPPQ